MKQRAFTLIELLVVVAIIVALLSILLPALNRSVLAAQEAVCAADQKQVALACLNYAADNAGGLPDLNQGVSGNAVYAITPDRRVHMEDRYGLSRSVWYSITNDRWNNDSFYYYPGGTQTSTTISYIGRMYFAGYGTGANASSFKMISPPPNVSGPLFPSRLSANSYFKFLWTDLNRQWPIAPSTDWYTPGDTIRWGANHMYEPNRVERSHVSGVDGSTTITDGNDLEHRANVSASEIWW